MLQLIPSHSGRGTVRFQQGHLEEFRGPHDWENMEWTLPRVSPEQWQEAPGLSTSRENVDNNSPRKLDFYYRKNSRMSAGLPISVSILRLELLVECKN